MSKVRNYRDNTSFVQLTYTSNGRPPRHLLFDIITPMAELAFANTLLRDSFIS